MILCCGEALIDMIPVRTTGGSPGFVPCNGGAALNTAISLARMGASSGLLTGLSHDPFGRQIVAALDAAGVDRSLSVTTGRPTTLAFVHLEAGEASYTFYDENSAMRMMTPDDLPPLPDHVRCLLLGGISLCHTPGADMFEALSKRGGGRLIMFDPNVRSSFIGDEPAYRARLGRLMARADIVKLSGPDLDWIDAGDVPWQDRLDKVLHSGPSLILFTRGAKGAIACHRDGRRIKVAAPKVEVLDTVGAGDAFNAGFLARLQALDLLNPKKIETMKTDVLRDCLTGANNAAAASLSRSGGAWGSPIEGISPLS
ncbi:MAG: carbohydrate kinase [Rhodobacteraceae bacterium]|nr:carbohydrate kinase [Paracoccaceae bacterium]